MARVFIDGFESSDMSLWDFGYDVQFASGITGMTGTCLNFTTGIRQIGKNIPANADYYVAFKWRPTGNAGGPNVIAYFTDSGGNTLGSLCIHSTGPVMSAYRGWSNGTLLASSSAGAFSLNTTYLVEIYYKPHASSGSFVVKLNGNTIINFSGNSGTTTNVCGFNLYSTQYSFAPAYFDDVIIDNANWIGSTYIQAIRPTGAGSNTAWTPSAGSNYACVDETTPSDTDYVSVNSNDQVDSYATGDLTGTIGTVKCVQVVARTRREGTPTPTQLQHVLRSGGADYVGSTKFVPQYGFSALNNIWETDPADSQPWTDTKVNALEIGVKAVA